MSHTAAPDAIANSMPADTDPSTAETATEQGRSGSGGVVETVKSYLGLGGDSAATSTQSTSYTGQDTELPQEGNPETQRSYLGLGGDATSAGTSVTADRTESTEVDQGKTDTVQHGDAMAQEIKDATGTQDPAQKEAQRETEEAKAQDPTHKPPQGAGESNKGTSGGRSGGLENRSAIPTAGGEQLGEKHWGESKKIPDNPAPQQESAGISSSEGQPTEQVRSNTAANTGGAVGGPGSDVGDAHEKEKVTDKLKDKLHLGSR